MSANRVIKRDGHLAEIDISKIQKQTSDATFGLKNVSQSELELDAHIQFRDKMTTDEIQKTLIGTAVTKTDIDRPDWTYVAARLFVYDLYHTVGKVLDGDKGSAYCHLSKYFEHGVAQQRLIRGLAEKFNLDELNDAIVPERDFLFNYLGIKTLFDRYLIKDREKNCFELPQQMFMGICMFLAQEETDVDNKKLRKKLRNEFDSKDSEGYLKAVRTYWAKEFYNILSTHEVMLATPTLSNARTVRHQLSSCYIGSTPDNIEGIFDSYHEMALLSKYGGGIGWDWNQVRGMASFIAGHKGAAGGTVPFLKIANDVAIAVDQLGTRKGAIAVYIETWHIDIPEFLDLKKNSGEERRRTHDLFPALWINDLFMERVGSGEQWSLFSPDTVPGLTEVYGDEFKALYEKYEADESIPRDVVSAREIWKKVLTQYFETGSPFLTFKDTANRANPNGHAGIIRSSNLCTEIFQNTSPNKYLTKIEFIDGEIVTFEETDLVQVDAGFKKQANTLTALDSIDGKRIFIVEKHKIDGETAVCNLGSINLSKIYTRADVERVTPILTRMLDNVIDLNFYPLRKVKVTNHKTRAIGLGVMGEAQMVAETGLVWGSQEHFNKIDEIMEAVSYNTIKASARLGQEKGNYTSFKNSSWNKGIMPIDVANENARGLTNVKPHYDWDLLRKETTHSMRNGYLMAIAPTSSISILVGTSQAIEPIYKRKWFEENLSGLIPVVAPNLSPDNWAGYIPAYEIDQILLIKAAAIRQKWLDQGQSTNVFLTVDKVSGKLLNQIYTTAWKFGLKSTYYLRSESPDASKAEMSVADRSVDCEGCQ